MQTIKWEVKARMHAKGIACYSILNRVIFVDTSMNQKIKLFFVDTMQNGLMNPRPY